MPTFTEPPAASSLSPLASRQLVLFGALASLALLVVGVWQRSFNAFLGAAVLIAAIVLIYLQHRHDKEGRTISVDAEGIQVGDKAYALTELAGFWLWEGDGGTEVTLETPKPAFFPTVFLYPGELSEARALFSMYLSELEPRRTAGQNPVDRFLKL